MLFPIMIFLMVLSPLFIPIAVTVVHGFGNWRSRRVARPVGSRLPVPPGRRSGASRRVDQLSLTNVTPVGVTFDAFGDLTFALTGALS